MCCSLSACVCAHKQQRTKHKLTVFIVSLPALSRRRRRRRCLCILICFAPLPNADVIAIQSCHCTQRASLSLVYSPLPLSFSLPLTRPASLCFSPFPGRTFWATFAYFRARPKSMQRFFNSARAASAAVRSWCWCCCLGNVLPALPAYFLLCSRILLLLLVGFPFKLFSSYSA